MKNWVRKQVSGKRNRYQEDGYNIDLSYICQNRIIVMSYPATGTKTIWRNDLNKVKEFLIEKHPDHYHVFNVSEKAYDWKLFD